MLIDMLVAAFGEDTDLAANSDPALKNIQETTVHIVAALNVWRLRWRGTSLNKMLEPAPYPTPRLLRAALHEEKRAFWRYFASLKSDAPLEKDYAYMNTRGESFKQPLAAMMQHVVNHSSYHRGQITARLMTLGHDVVIQSTDFSTWTMLEK
jgi:uncharacterized damage-inducible protein DinB